MAIPIYLTRRLAPVGGNPKAYGGSLPAGFDLTRPNLLLTVDTDPIFGQPTTEVNIIVAVAVHSTQDNGSIPNFGGAALDGSEGYTVEDSKGNVYTLDSFSLTSDGKIGIYWFSSLSAIALVIGDTIHVGGFGPSFAMVELNGLPIAAFAVEALNIDTIDKKHTNEETYPTPPTPDIGTGVTATVTSTSELILTATVVHPNFLSFYSDPDPTAGAPSILSTLGPTITGLPGGQWNTKPPIPASGSDELSLWIANDGGGFFETGYAQNDSAVCGYSATTVDLGGFVVDDFAGTIIDNAQVFAAIVTYKGLPRTFTFAGDSDCIVATHQPYLFAGESTVTFAATVNAHALIAFTGDSLLQLPNQPVATRHVSGLVFDGDSLLRVGRLYSLFNDLGLLIGRINLYGGFIASHVPSEAWFIVNHFLAKPDADGLFSTFANIGGDVTSWRRALADFADARLRDVDRVVRELRLAVDDTDTILDALGERMIDDNETVNRTTVTIGDAVAHFRNRGDGVVFTTKILDGFSSPINGAAVHDWYAGLASELATSQAMVLICTTETDTAEEGTEAFRWNGEPSTDAMTWGRESSGSGPNVSVAGEHSILENGSFEDWQLDVANKNVPSAWTIDVGTAGVSFIEEQDANNVFRDLASLKLVLGGNPLKLSQSVAATVDPARRYHVSVRVKGAQVAGGTLTLRFEGSGYSASASEQIKITTDTLTDDWTLYTFWINTPDYIPDTDKGDAVSFAFVIRIDQDPNQSPLLDIPTDLRIWIDSLCVEPVVYFGGVGVVIVPGATRFRLDDRFDFIVTSDQAGRFQEFFRRHWATQLPSSVSATISDTLCD